MNWDALGAIAELVGALAVILTLAYLARQISQNTKMMSAQAYQARSDSLVDINMTVADSPVLATIQDKVLSMGDDGVWQLDEKALQEFTSTEISQLKYVHIAHVHRMDNLITQYELGFLNEEYYQFGIMGTARQRKQVWEKLGIVQAKRIFERIEAIENVRKR